MSQAQTLEHGMVNTLLVFLLMPTICEHRDGASWGAAFDRFFDIELGRTFGNLLKRVAEIPGFPADLLGRLRSAKIDRDHLAHRYFREHDMDFMTAAGRTRMIVECEELIQRFAELDCSIEVFADAQRREYGYTAEWVTQKVAEMIAQAEESERTRPSQ